MRRVFRPFPVSQLNEALKNIKVLAALDRVSSPGAFGSILFQELRSAFYDLSKKPIIIDYIYGLGGRDITVENITSVYEEALKILKTGKTDPLTRYLGVREG